MLRFIHYSSALATFLSWTDALPNPRRQHGPPQHAPPHHGHPDECIVNTTSGRLRPLIESSYPEVEQYLGIPFAAPPVEDLRFAPPQPFQPSEAVIDATQWPPGCVQPSGPPTVFTEYEPGFSFLGPQSEDCLQLNVFRPISTPATPLPVIIYVYGGGFNTGATNVSYFKPMPWVQDKQNLIVRVNIFGFPNSAALDQQNLGLQDIRFATQWVKDNIAAFGGDADRITLWGHSAGSIAVDAYTYSHVDEPIVRSTISTSGTTFTPQEGWQSMDTAQSNFTFVAHQLQCTGDAEALLECMRSKPASAIADFVYGYNGTDALTFKPIVDGEWVFVNYSTQLQKGAVMKVPGILGNSRREGERSLDHSLNPAGPNETLALAYTVVAFVCPGQLTAELKVAAGVPVHRYEWAGNFSNISPLPWMGAYHASLLPFFFGQTDCAACHPLSGASTPFELAVGSHMQDLWRAFAADPDNLSSQYAWPAYEGGKPGEKGDAVKLIPGPDGSGQVSSLELGAKREGYCAKVDPYLISQTLPEGLAEELGAGGIM